MGKITARVIDEYNGLSVHESIKAVRILSDDYVLLIMEDYTPTIGKINGDVVILTDEGEKKYPGVDGFFKHQDNVFSLFIKSYAGNSEQ